MPHQPPSANKKKKLQTETCELFSAYLAQSQEGDCHEKEEKASSFYEEPFLETMNFETLVNWKIVNFFPGQKRYTVVCFDIFSHYVRALTRVEVGSLSKVQKSAGFHAAQVYTQCLFRGVFVHFVNLSG